MERICSDLSPPVAKRLARSLAILDEIYGNDRANALTGRQLTCAIRTAGLRSGRGGELPIIGATGNETEDFVAAALAAGQCAVWGKPAPSKEQMLQDLRRALVGSNTSG